MMTTLTEGDLQVSFGDADSARKFDGDEHQLSHCMKAVDFIVEFSDRYLFIEFKDPQDPEAQGRNSSRFTENFKSGALDNDLKYKYRDSFLYEWAYGRVDKPVYYFVLVALDSLNAVQLGTRTDSLKRQLPLQGPKGNPFTRSVVSGCAVFNIASWNKRFPKYPINRLSDT